MSAEEFCLNNVIQNFKKALVSKNDDVAIPPYIVGFEELSR